MKFLSGIPVQTFCAYFDLKNANVHIFDGYAGPNGGGFLVNNAGTNEQQTLVFGATPTAGHYNVKWNGVTTPNLTLFTSAELQAALRALSTVNGANVNVSGGANTLTIEWVGKMASKPQPLVVVTSNTLTDVSTNPVTITVSETVPGVYAYAAGVGTMTVDGGTGAYVNGEKFTLQQLDFNVASDLTEYTITGHSETGPNTTSITFLPTLTQGVQDDEPVVDVPHSLNVKLGDGNFTFTEKKPREYKKNRGFLDAVRNGDEDPLEVKLEFAWIFIKSSSGEPITVEDALKQTGNAANWVTAGHDPCEPYCVTIRLVYVPPCPGVDNEVIDLAEFRYEELQHDAKTGMIACTAKCNLTKPTVTRIPKTAYNQDITH
jgi:hypothetical protein